MASIFSTPCVLHAPGRNQTFLYVTLICKTQHVILEGIYKPTKLSDKTEWSRQLNLHHSKYRFVEKKCEFHTFIERSLKKLGCKVQNLLLKN